MQKAAVSHKLIYRLVSFNNWLLTKYYAKTVNLLIKIYECKDLNNNIDKAYISSQRNLKSFKKLFRRIEKAGYFDNAYTVKVSESILINLYLIEGHYRMIVLKGKPNIKGDDYLKDFASDISLGSLQA